MKYLFLDIDGVLNHEDWYVNRIGKYRDSFKEWWEECFDPECVKRVKHILEETGAKIVISSSWRFDPYIKYYFEKIGLPLKKYLRTPNLHTEEGWPDRGEEIDAFLKEHPCDNYVILDDDKDFTEDQLKHHFVHCCADFPTAYKEGHVGETGLTDRKMKQAIEILNSTK